MSQRLMQRVASQIKDQNSVNPSLIRATALAGLRTDIADLRRDPVSRFNRGYVCGRISAFQLAGVITQAEAETFEAEVDATYSAGQ